MACFRLHKMLLQICCLEPLYIKRFAWVRITGMQGGSKAPKVGNALLVVDDVLMTLRS